MNADPEAGTSRSTSLTPELKALLSFQRALLGCVSPNVRGACVEVGDATVDLICYVRPEITEDESVDLRCAETEVMADYPPDVTVGLRSVVVSDQSEPLPTVGRWVYLQRGLRVTS